MHCRSNIYFLNKVPFRQVTINTTHEIYDTVTEKDRIESTFHALKHRLRFVCYFQSINKVNLVAVDLFCWVVGWLLYLFKQEWRQSIFVTTKDGYLPGLTGTQQLLDEHGTDGSGRSSYRDIHSIKV